MPKSKVTARKHADENHDVVSVVGGAGYRRTPCAECPWRRDSPVGAFPAEAFRLSAPTAYDLAESQFGCHMAGAQAAVTCAGFLLRGAYHNLGTRKARTFGKYDPSLVDEAGVELYDNYREMAEANGVDPKDPVLQRCRE